ncbi:MAG: hypothetical protein H6R19_2617 [Proteobacteria bacterium]|nr:hypothetical protein [Pseudomonadota bacterium]
MADPGGLTRQYSWRLAWLAALWGLAEATVFFIVPDVLLSGVALRCPWSQVWRLCSWSLLGALLGGYVMFRWGAADALAAVAVLQQIPAIDAAMCDAVAQQLREQGLPALFIGPLSGVPYKIYAVQAGGQQLSLLLFLGLSVPARLLRFLAVAGATRWICERLPGMTTQVRMILWVLGWGGFYAWYFWHFASAH